MESKSVGWFKIFGWSLGLLVSGLAIAVWLSSYNWSFAGMDTYDIFPVLGLVAFSLMWTHYIIGGIRRYLGLPTGSLKAYYRYTGYLVFALILLHPGLFLLQLWHDGYGAPPGSYKSYLGESSALFAMLGSVSLLAFLGFETWRWFGKKSWWWVVQRANDLAMFGIFIHALKLGGQLAIAWYCLIWFFYGVTLLIVIGYDYQGLWRRRSAKTPTLSTPS